MKIRVKVKSIILFILAGLLVYLVVIPFTTLELAKYLDRKGSDKARIFYESFISKALIWNKSEALYEYGKGLTGADGKFQLMMMGWGGGGTSSLEDMGKGIAALKEVLEKEGKSNKDEKYTVLAYEEIMDSYIRLLSPEDLIYWIEWGKKSDNKKVNYTSDLYLSFYHFANRDYDLAEELLNKYSEDSEYIDYRYYYMKGELALWKGDVELSKKLFEAGKDERYLKWNHNFSLFGSYSYEYRDYWFEDHYDKLRGNLKLRGKVSFNGKPMPFVEVYLQETGKGFRTGGGYLIGITDINGEYETLGFQPDRYEIGIGLNQAILYDKVYQNPSERYIDLGRDMEFDFSFVSPFKVINPGPEQVLKGNKFTVEWETVKDAAYYQVNVTAFSNPLNKSGGNMSFPIEDENYNIKLRANKVVFDMKVLRDRSGGLSWSGEEMIVSPTGILSSFIPGNEYPIVVNAYDNNGKLLSSSAPLRTHYEDFPSIKIQGELTEGEKLIYNMKYEESIEYYSNILENEPNNEEALFYLAKIYMVGYRKGKENYDKSMEYAARYDNLRANNSLKYKLIEFMDHKSRRKYRDIIKEVFNSIPKQNIDDNFYYNQGRYYLSLGEYTLARESFENIKSYNHIYIMYIDLYHGEIDKVLELISSGDLDLYNMNKKEMEKALKGIGDNIETKDYEVIKGVIQKVLSEDINRHDGEGNNIGKKARLEIKDSYIKILLEQIIQDNHWDIGVEGEKTI